MKKIMLVLMFMFFIISCDNGERTVMNVEDQNITDSLDDEDIPEEDPDTNMLDEELITDQDFTGEDTPDEDIPDEECPIGSINCECYGNGTCDEGLVCNLDHCEPIPAGDRFSVIDAEDDQKIIIDNDTGLTWASHAYYQIGGIYDQKYMCIELNSMRFGGFADWRPALMDDYITIINPIAKNRLKDCNLPTTSSNRYDSLEDVPYIESDCRLSGLNAMDYIFYDVFKENFPDLTKWKDERPPYVAAVGYYVGGKSEAILLSPTEGFFIQVEKGVSFKAPIFRRACVR